MREIQGLVAVDGDDVDHVAGGIVWWKLRGDLDEPLFARTWEAEGLDPKFLPTPPSPATALRRSMNEFRRQRTLIRPLGKGKGLALVKERTTDEARQQATGEGELDYHLQWKASVDAVGRLTVKGLDGHEPPTEELNGLFQKHLATLSDADISHWLIREAKRLDAVPLRDGGGIYFVPRYSLHSWHAISLVLSQCSSHVIYKVPTMRTQDAVAAIIDAISTEAELEAKALEEALAEDHGHQALAHRVKLCEQVEAKVEKYEGVIGQKLDTLRERLEVVRANLSVAMLAAMSEADKKTGT